MRQLCVVSGCPGGVAASRSHVVRRGPGPVLPPARPGFCRPGPNVPCIGWSPLWIIRLVLTFGHIVLALLIVNNTLKATIDIQHATPGRCSDHYVAVSPVASHGVLDVFGFMALSVFGVPQTL